MSNNITSGFVFNPNQQYLFRRSYTLSIGTRGNPKALQYGTIGKDGKYLGDGCSPLRINFDIDKNMAGTANQSKIEIYNMAIETRESVKKGSVLLLTAGYNNIADQIFVGNVINAYSARKGPDIVTTFECGEGEASIVMSTLDKSYPEGTKLSQILHDCAVALSVADQQDPLGVSAGVILGIPDNVVGSFTAHGQVKDILNTLLRPLGLEWNIQNGALNIIPLTAYNGNPAIRVASGVVTSNGKTAFDPSESTGLIGVPSNTTYFTQFTSLLNPKIIPGSLVDLVSENTKLNGVYKIRRCHYEGDSHDTKWQVTCEAIRQSGGLQNLPASKGFDIGTAVV